MRKLQKTDRRCWSLCGCAVMPVSITRQLFLVSFWSTDEQQITRALSALHWTLLEKPCVHFATFVNCKSLPDPLENAQNDEDPLSKAATWRPPG